MRRPSSRALEESLKEYDGYLVVATFARLLHVAGMDGCRLVVHHDVRGQPGEEPAG